jgi:hypothetical protein
MDLSPSFKDYFSQCIQIRIVKDPLFIIAKRTTYGMFFSNEISLSPDYFFEEFISKKILLVLKTYLVGYLVGYSFLDDADVSY